MGLLQVLETHVYNTSGVDNPCLRNKFGRGEHCFFPWGFTIAQYHAQYNCTAAPLRGRTAVTDTVI